MANIVLIQALATRLTQDSARCAGTEFSPYDALGFLYNLARLEKFSDAELEAAKVLNLVEHSQLLRDTHPQIAAVASTGLDPLALTQCVRDVTTGALDATRWVEDVFMVATVEPWLSPQKKHEANLAVGFAGEVVSSYPHALRKAARVALERLAEERVTGLPAAFCDQVIRSQAASTLLH